MLFGGLYEDNGSNGTSGLPFVSTIPVLGGLFGTQSWSSSRTELVMLVTPRILATAENTRSVIDELRANMTSIESFAPSASRKVLPTSAQARQELQQRRAAEAIPSEFNQSLKVQPNNAER